MLYNETGSNIFVGEEAIKAALEAGWKDVPVAVAQPPKGDDNSAAKVQELNKALVSMDADLRAAKQAQTEAEAKAADALDRATAAEDENKKLAAALKKAQSDARK